MITYKPTITDIGIQQAINDNNDGVAFKITHVSFGDSKFEPTGKETTLNDERIKVQLSSTARVNDSTFKIRARVRSKVPFYCQSIGFWCDGVLFAVFSSLELPPTGIFNIHNATDTVVAYSLSLDKLGADKYEVILTADEDYLNQLISTHEDDPNAHGVRDLRDLVNTKISNEKKSNAVDSTSEDTVATSLAVKKANDNANTRVLKTDFETTEIRSVNANEILNNGIYCIISRQGSSNLPGSSSGNLFVTKGAGNDSNFLQQTFYEHYTGKIWYRYRQQNGDFSFADWREIMTSAKASSAVDSASGDTVATSLAVKTAYDKGVEAYDYAKKLNDSFIGTVQMFAYDKGNAPEGFLWCDKGLYNPQDYPELFAKIGYVHGQQDGKFSTPDQKEANAFPRCAGGDLKVGMTQGDAIRNIEGSFCVHQNIAGYNILPTMETQTGVFEESLQRGGYYLLDRNTSSQKTAMNKTIFNASKIVPTADENRPNSTVYAFAIKYK